MANYTSNLKTWGSTGSEFPSGYNYVEGEQPVDEWDNFVNHNVIDDLINHLIPLTNKRLESLADTSTPSSPELGHQFYDTDDDEQYVYNGSKWRRFLYADGDKMTGSLDMQGHTLNDSSGTLDVSAGIDVTGKTSLDGASLDNEWFSKQEGGSVSAGSIVPVGTFGLEDGESINVTQAMLTRDGFTTPCVSGVDLVLVPDGSSNTTILSGDGTTLYDDETGTPLVQYTNTTGGHQTVMIGIDNGNYNSGYGDVVDAFGGYIARVV